MGIAASSSSGGGNALAGEGEHFNLLVNPPRIRPSSASEEQSSGKSEKEANKPKRAHLHHKARLIQRLNFADLWEQFLASTANSFALTPSELLSLLQEVIGKDENLKAKSEQTLAGAEIKDYISLVADLSEKDTSKTVDFMAVVSSALLLGQFPIEMKVDQLFAWIVLNPELSEFQFEDFVIAICSFERGLSHAMGRTASNEAFVKEVAAQWFALADPYHRGLADPQTKISQLQFFDFCTNRHHVVRRLLESFLTLKTFEDKNTELQEITDTVDALKKPLTGGDEWMANPAWKKTAEKMVPPDALQRYKDAKPTSNLELDWVYGYRGFDCRNNVFYGDSSGSSALYPAAALTVLHDLRRQDQSYFGEHRDDVTALTVILRPQGALIASGELGKQPAIYLYQCLQQSLAPLACFRGFHTKGIGHLALSSDGKYLFSIGIEYSVAVYACDPQARDFGKMVASAQGPKDRVLHCAYCAAHQDEELFLSCGEKHVIVWTFHPKRGLKQDLAKSAAARSQIFLSAVAVGQGNRAVLSTQSGEFFVLNVEEKSVSPVRASPADDPAWSHGKSAVNALAASAERADLLVSGDKDGKVVVWVVSPTTDGVVMKAVGSFVATGGGGSTGGATITEGEQGPIKGGSKGSGGSSEASKTPGAAAKRATKSSADESSGVAVRALSLSPDTRRVLVGTQTCEIWEFPLPSPAAMAPTGRNIVLGHYLDEVWGLAVRPVNEGNCGEGGQFATTGDDRYLRVWSVPARRQLASFRLPCASRACAYSPDGLYLAVGLGGGGGRKQAKAADSWEGGVKIFRIEGATITCVADVKDGKQAISCLAYSPDGTLLAVGSRDNSIYIYSVPNQYKRKHKFSKHNAGILQLDFSSDGKYIQSCCSAYEILFSDTSTGAQVTDAAARLRDCEWNTWTCTLGWSVQGIWHGAMDGSDVNAVARSPSQRFVASADDFGAVSVYQYPVLNPKGGQRCQYFGHSAHVTNVRWMSKYEERKGGKVAGPRGDDYLISTGGNDKCVFQWRHSDPKGPSAIAVDSVTDHQGPEVDEETDVFGAGPAGGDEFMAVKPWLGAIVAPTHFLTPDAQKIPPFLAALGEYATLLQAHQSISYTSASEMHSGLRGLKSSSEEVLQRQRESGLMDPSPPVDELALDWVHGYRGYDCRNNAFFFQNRGRLQCIYYAAALGIVAGEADPSARNSGGAPRTQKYFRGHTDDILCMTTVCVGGQTLVATGQIGPGSVFVWDPATIATVAIVPTKQKTIQHVAFSNDGRLLVCVSEDLQLCVYDWKAQLLVSSTKIDSVLLSMSVVPTGPSLQIACAGNKLLRLFTLQGRNLISTKYVTSTCGGTTIQAFPTICALPAPADLLVVGCEDGALYVIPREGKGVTTQFSHIDKAAPAAAAGEKGGKGSKAITAIHWHPGGHLVTGSRDSSVTFWDASSLPSKPRKLFAFLLNSDAIGPKDKVTPQIHALSLHEGPGGQWELLVGTRGCDLFTLRVNLTPGREAVTFLNVVTRGHCNDEVWGIAAHPSLPLYLSTGDDKTLRVYSSRQRAVLAIVGLGHIARAAQYSPSGDLVAVGFGGRVGKGKESGGGLVRLYSHVATDGGEHIEVAKLCERKDAKQWISDVKFSTDGRTLCAAAHDCKVYVYEVASAGPGPGRELRLKCTFSKHNAVVTHLDISQCSRYMQSTCAAYELLFCDLATGRQVTAPGEVKDVGWATVSCPLGWSVQGIWGAASVDGSDVNAVSRSHTGHLLASGTDAGDVLLYRHPAAPGAKAVPFKGHSSHVMGLTWSCGDEFLLSTGGNDKCVFQWRHDMDGAAGPAPAHGKSVAFEGGSIGGDSDSDSDSERGSGEVSAGRGGTESSLLSGPAGGDESGCVKPWLGAVRPPRQPPAFSAQAPAVELALQWVHGYSCSPLQYARPNCFYQQAGRDIVYPAAALGVSLHRPLPGADAARQELPSQTHLRGHDDDVLCLTMSADRRFVATGQIASKALKGKASVIVWSALDHTILTRLEGVHQRGVQQLAFNGEGSKLLSVGMDDAFSHSVWMDVGGNWSRVQLVATNKGDKQPVQFLLWAHPQCQGEYHFLSGGARLVSLWKVEGASLTKKSARAGKKSSAAGTAAKDAVYLSAAHIHHKGAFKTVLGTQAGDLCCVGAEGEVATEVERAHEGAVLALALAASHELLVSGGKDGWVKVWNASLQLVSSVDLCAAHLRAALATQLLDVAIVSLDALVVAAAATKDTQPHLQLLVGTAGGDVLELDCMGASRTVPAPGPGVGAGAGSASDAAGVAFDLAKSTAAALVSSHCRAELWGLAAHPLDADLAATAGDDGSLRVWSTRRRACVQVHRLTRAARTVAWHPLGHLLAVGLHDAGKKKTKAAGAGAKGKKAAGKTKGAAAAAPALVEGDEDDPEASGGAAGLDSPTAGVLLFSFRASAGPGGGAELVLRAALSLPGGAAFPAVTDLKFSPRGDLLLVAAADCKLRGYTLPALTSGDPHAAPWDEFRAALAAPAAFVFDKHSSKVAHFDVSVDQQFLQSTDLGNELLFYDLARRRQEPSASKVADYNGQVDDDHEGRLWATQTCPFGWAVQGIWPPNAYDSSEVNAVDRHSNLRVLATGEDSGLVRVLRYPAVVPAAQAVELRGHASHVTNVRWGPGSSLYSTGGNDRCLFVWEMQEK